ncbi:MAG TPA: hypothetical protein DCY94_01160 [Firmicutes bacterium]|nr:hypothetical protein [Bacillota bacterium]
MERKSIKEYCVVQYIENVNRKIKYFICHESRPGCYVDALSGEAVSSDVFRPELICECIGPLTNFGLAIQGYDVEGENLPLLEKNDLARIYSRLNDEKLLEREFYKAGENLSTILEKATVHFFPKSGHWDHLCFRRSNELRNWFLPCHLHDDLWLAKFLKMEGKLYFISDATILGFVRSQFFQGKRKEYELEIVRWQIDWMIKGGDNWLVREEFGGCMSMLSPLWDLAFRQGVIDTLVAIGLDKSIVEEGLERNSSMWRDIVMRQAFDNAYQPIIADMKGYTAAVEEGKKFERLVSIMNPPGIQHFELWLKLRKYEYYQRHKAVVDEFGSVEEDMSMSSLEASNLRLFLERKHNERMEYLERYEKAYHEGRLLEMKPVSDYSN